ncbi:MAG: hypothetical protein QOF64_2254 [Candidatus Binatota bacterium]|nr:hypothetical protein [Candidatus Binatota bacterium]
MILHQMAKPHPPVRWNKRGQIRFDLVGIGVAGKTQALRKPHHVGVDADGWFAEGIAENNVSGLTAHARKTDQVIEIVGDLAAKALDQLTATVMNCFGFVAIKVDLVDLAFQLVGRDVGVIAGATILLEQFHGDLIDEIVARLRREDQRDQQLERVPEVEVELGIRMDFFEPGKDLFYSCLFVTGRGVLFAGCAHFGFW